MGGFVLFPGGLVHGPCRYYCVWVLKADLVVPGVGFRKSGCLFATKVFGIKRVSFACVNDQQYLTIL